MTNGGKLGKKRARSAVDRTVGPPNKPHPIVAASDLPPNDACGASTPKAAQRFAVRPYPSVRDDNSVARACYQPVRQRRSPWQNQAPRWLFDPDPPRIRRRRARNEICP